MGDRSLHARRYAGSRGVPGVTGAALTIGTMSSTPPRTASHRRRRPAGRQTAICHLATTRIYEVIENTGGGTANSGRKSAIVFRRDSRDERCCLSGNQSTGKDRPSADARLGKLDRPQSPTMFATEYQAQQARISLNKKETHACRTYGRS